MWEVMDFLEAYEAVDDVSAYYSSFSQAVEKGWFVYLDGGKEFRKTMQCRGKVTIVRKKMESQRKSTRTNWQSSEAKRAEQL